MSSRARAMLFLCRQNKDSSISTTTPEPPICSWLFRKHITATSLINCLQSTTVCSDTQSSFMRLTLSEVINSACVSEYNVLSSINVMTTPPWHANIFVWFWDSSHEARIRFLGFISLPLFFGISLIFRANMVMSPFKKI